MNRALAAVEAFSRLSGVGVLAGMEGPNIGEPEPGGFWGLVTAVADPNASFAPGVPAVVGDLGPPCEWRRQMHVRGDDGAPRRIDHPLAGTYIHLPAFEVSGNPPAADELPTLAWFERGDGDFYLFQCCCNEISGSGGGSG